MGIKSFFSKYVWPASSWFPKRVDEAAVAQHRHDVIVSNLKSLSLHTDSVEALRHHWNAHTHALTPVTPAVFVEPIVNHGGEDDIPEIVVPVVESSDTDYIQADFEVFHRTNPDVYRKLVELAFIAKANGHSFIGIGLLWERLRWFLQIETTGYRYKLNNNLRSRYSRLIMENVPALDGFFRTRRIDY